MKKSLFLMSAALLTAAAFAKLEPATLFNDNMVLQRGREVPVWGKAAPGSEVTVAFGGLTATATAGADGRWRANLPAMAAESKGREFTIAEKGTDGSGDRIAFRNVVVGEVWLCGGQSNMTFAMWPVNSIGQHAGRERNGYFDLALTDEPEVRGVHMPLCWAAEEKDHARLDWFDFTPDHDRGNFSAAAWHFAMRLHYSLKVPVGVIECAWGGSCIETWIPPFAYAESKSFKAFATKPIRTELTAAEKAQKLKTKRNPSLHQQPRACWNAMVSPLAPFAIKGAIWYQGCSNRSRWREYYEMLSTLRAGWDRAFECGGDMPFFLCQITPYGYSAEASDPGETEIREEMERFGRSNGPNVGCAICSDVGEIDNIHPGDKRTVATRLAALALNRVYGFKKLKCDAPVFERASVSADGAKITLSFKNVEGWNRNGTYRERFEIADANGKWTPVKAEYATKGNVITLEVPAGISPVKVAYMRKSCVHGFIKNEAGLPLGPFRCELPPPVQLGLKPGSVELVLEKGAAKVVAYAAAEMADVLEKTLGKRPEIVEAPRTGFVSIVLGDGALARAAGIDVKTLKRDAFTILEKGGMVFIAGRDDLSADPAKVVARGGLGQLEFERGTLFGAYEFLERFAGARFYFPGELGTVIQKQAALAIPVGFALTRAPVFTVRNPGFSGDGAVPGETNTIPWNPTAYGGEVTPETQRFRGTWKAKNWLRLRLQTESIPCCHGQRGFDYPRRFHATHPEYFALSKKRADGGWDRDVTDDFYAECGTHLCHSSAVWEEFYQDARAYFSGAKAETRGIRRLHRPEFAWGFNFKQHRFVDVMPQDGLPQCHCEKCQQAYEGQTGGQFATELIWSRTADLARKLGAEFPNAIVTQMAYWPYRNVPKCELPSNLWVMVAEYGPWSYAYEKGFKRDVEELKAWYEKLGHKVWMWTYPSKFGRKACPGIPDMAPRTWVKTYRAYAPYSMGAFCEAECDNSMYHYLNYYVYAKLGWDLNLDEEALLAEHFRLMFGAAAPEMAEFYADLERKWTQEVIHTGDSYVGGTRLRVASEESLYGDIYSSKVCAGWAALFDRAAVKLAPGSIEARRVAFFREQFLEKIVKAAADYARVSDISKPHPHDAAKNMLVDSAKEHEIVVTPDQKPFGGRSLPQTGYILKFAQNFEADTEYRLSYCFELDAKNPWGTFFTQFSTGPGQWINVQKGGLAGGKVKPSYREYVFSTPKKIGPKEKHSFGFYLTGEGRAKVWNIHLEKLSR